MSATIFSRFHAVRFVIATLLFAGVGPLLAQGITYPTFTTSNKIAIKLNGSPAFTKGPDGHLWIAYADANNSGKLSVASSSDGINFTVHQSGYGMGSDPAIVTTGNGTLLVAFYGNNNFELISATNGSFGQPTYFVPSGTPYAYKPALAVDAYGDLYLAWVGRAYDPGSGEYDGQWIDAAYSTTNGASFTQNGTAISESYSALGGPALTLRSNGNLYLTYLDGATGNPHVFATSGNTSLSFTETSPTGGAGGHYAGDASSVDFTYLFPMFRSAYSADNLWAIGTSDGYNYGPAYMYGQTLSFSPALAVANGNVLYQGERSNFGNDLWILSATYNEVNPF